MDRDVKHAVRAQDHREPTRRRILGVRLWLPGVVVSPAPLRSGSQLDEQRVARARAEGIDKREQRFADEALRVIGDEE
jgi:hypothetical protein